MALRHLGRAAAAVCTRAAMMGLPQETLRAAQVGSLLSLSNLVVSPSPGWVGGACQQGAAAPAAAAPRSRSFASSSFHQGNNLFDSESLDSSSGGSSSVGGSLGGGSGRHTGAEAAAPVAAGGASGAPASLWQRRRGQQQQQQQQQCRAVHGGHVALQEMQQHVAELPARSSFKVEAAYVGSKVNIYDLMNRPEFSGHYKKLHKGTVVLGLTRKPVDPACEIQGMPLDPYMVAFSYGSVVFFNTDREMKDAYLALCREEAADPIPADKPYMEEYAVTVDAKLPFWSRLEADNVELQALDLKNIQVISQVLAQSVAMDFYSSHVERTLETFCNMNLEMQESKNITKINKQVLLQMVAENNIVMTDIINKLGVHERYDIAWKHVQYGRIWEFLRAELEMDARFKTLDMKLNLIQDNLKYFLEILQNRKSDTLEWIIIILIGAEICLSLYDLAMKGLGG